MTETISKKIDAKLDPLAEVVYIHAQQLDNCKTRIDEAKQRIVSAEEIAESMQAHVLPLKVKLHHLLIT